MPTMPTTRPRTWDRLAVDALIAKRSEAELAAMAAFARRHFAILAGELCPHCDSTDTESHNDEGAHCRGCGEQWDFRDWRRVEVVGGRMYPAGC